ncbi:ABC transporter substrate-binding protein [Fundidesulfovibrio soli]|uniref:ABC transporter substrate-binding protein n=1 Tax=Fundidesulfovibrio soli TaxID=2922716 RepID=UPI001FAF4697|nr:extracellular solute-binding protein [Fundidesulfovibrio soli]
MTHPTPVVLRFARQAVLALFMAHIAALPASSAQITLLHYWTGSLAGGIAQMVESYNATSSNSRIVAQGMEHESFKPGIKSMLAWGSAPDIFSYWAGARLRSMVDAGYAAPLDELWEGHALERLFAPSVAQACMYDGKYYAVPVTQHVVGMFYNKAVFSRLGIAPPATWEQFLAACERIHKAGISPIALGARELWPAQYWFDQILLRTAGPEYRQRLTEGRQSYTDEEVKAAFAEWGRLLQNGYFHPDHATWDWAGAADAVRRGQAAMTLMGTWIIGYYGNDPSWRMGKDYGFFPFPAIKQNVPQVCSGPIDVLVLTPKGKREGGMQAMGFFSSVLPQEAMCRGSGAFAPNLFASTAELGSERLAILKMIRSAPMWVFPYDLAVPPAVADIGLGLFGAFLRTPGNSEALLLGTQQKIAAIYGASPDKRN